LLAFCVAVGVKTGFALPAAVLFVPVIFPLVFIYKGACTLLGKNVTLIRDGIGSISIGILLGAGALYAYSLWMILAAFLFVSGVLSAVAGFLLLIQRKQYVAWVRGEDR
jgi:hypothetical protein